MTDGQPPLAGSAYRVATEHFPAHKLVVKRLLKEDDAFRELCEELGAAEAAQVSLAGIGDQGAELVKSQWREIVERLVDEISVSIAAYEAGVLKHRNDRL